MMSEPTSSASRTLRCGKQLCKVAENLMTLYRGKEHTDITLIAGIDNMEVKTHRLVLHLSSGYFRTMFDSELGESKSKVIHLSTVDGDTLNKVIGFMYTFEIEMTKESIQKVLSAANLFQITTLIEGCCNLMADELNDSNCLSFLDLAAEHNYTTLYKKSLDYAYRHFEEVSMEEEFLKLTEEQLIKFLSQDGVNIVPQEILFLSLIKWLKYDKESREESMYILLNDFVRFAQLDPEFIVQNVEPVAHIAKCSKLCFSWLKWHSYQPAKQKKQKVVLAYTTQGVFRVDSYDPDSNKWSIKNWPQPSQVRRTYGIVISNDKCIIAGGRIGKWCTNSVECLDLKQMKWRYLPSMRTERFGFGMAVVNGVFYVVGGWNNTGWLSLVEKYDFSDGKWTNIAELPEALNWVRVVSIGGKLYASGDGISHLKCYDPAANRWSETSNRNEKSSYLALSANEEYIYTVGRKIVNDKSLNTMERYNPSKNSWTILKPMSTRRSRLTCMAVGEKVLVCGGNSGKKKHVFEEYNEKTKEWKDLADCLNHFENTSIFSNHLSTIFEQN